MLCVAIVEDNEKSIKDLCAFVDKYATESGYKISVDSYTDGIEIVDAFSGQYDIIFLDIKMKHMDGLEAAKKIREKDEKVIIGFITSMGEFAIKGYEVDARGFLLKPVTYMGFSKVFSKFVEMLDKRKEQYLLLNQAGGMKKIPLSEIQYLESIEHSVYIHLLKGIEKIYCSLKEMEEKLPPQQFFRCTNGIIVNLQLVESVKQYSLQIGEETLTISRPRKKAFLEALTYYISEE